MSAAVSQRSMRGVHFSKVTGEVKTRKFNLLHKPQEQDFHIMQPTQFQMPGVVVTASKRIRVPENPRKIFIKSATGSRKDATETKDTTAVEGEQKEIAFSDVVDEDLNDAFQNYLSDELIGRLTESGVFRFFILAIIVLNSVQAGVQTDAGMNQQFGTILEALDNIFLTIFVVELLLKWYAGFKQFWTSSWNIFDFLVVTASILGQAITFLASTNVLRVLRVLRAFRSLRSITALQGLQIIVQTIIKAIPSMMNIIVLLSIIMFVYAVTTVTLFGPTVPYYFADIARAFYTMFIFLTQDGWTDVLVELEKAGNFLAGSIMAMTFIPLGAYIFVNLVVGVTVNFLLQAYRDIKTQKRAKSRKLKQQRRRMDVADIKMAMAGIASQYADVTESNEIPTAMYNLQKALETPTLNVGPRYVQNYMAVLGAVEDNLREFRSLKNEINVCLAEVKAVNVENDVHVDDSDVETSSDESESDGDLQGDALSALMRERGKDSKAAKKKKQQSERASLARRMHMIEAIQEEQSRAERTRLWAQGRING